MAGDVDATGQREALRSKTKLFGKEEKGVATPPGVAMFGETGRVKAEPLVEGGTNRFQLRLDAAASSVSGNASKKYKSNKPVVGSALGPFSMFFKASSTGGTRKLQPSKLHVFEQGGFTRDLGEIPLATIERTGSKD